MKNVKGYLITLAVVLGALFMQLSPMQVDAQTNLQVPNITRSSALVIRWTAGTINNGGKAVSITASTAAVTADRTVCSSPTFSACNIVYSTSAGTVTVSSASNAITVANGSGNTVLAYISTSATDITRIVYPQQASVATNPGPQVIYCGITVTCTTGAAGGNLGTGVIVAFGSAAMSSSTAAITALPFTSSNTYGCVASLAATTTGVTAGWISAVPATGSTMNVTASYSGITTAVQFVCIGY